MSELLILSMVKVKVSKLLVMRLVVMSGSVILKVVLSGG